MALSLGRSGALVAQRGPAPAGAPLFQTAGAFVALSVSDAQASAR